MMKAWNNTDKTAWSDGEWNNEPDKAHWIDKETGLDCLIVRGPTGALCGYVGVPPQHSCYEMDYDAVYNEIDIDVHGGLTFSDKCHPNEDESKGICRPKEGAANENIWWLGFDCAHLGDISPTYRSPFCDSSSTYKNFEYVEKEITNLAKQLAKAPK